VSSYVRVLIGLVYMSIAAPLQMLLMLLLVPWRGARIRLCNYWGWVSGRFVLWLSGSTVHVHHPERVRADRQVIYVSNHTSVLDIFLGIWISPAGTVGVAKKEVVWYPFFGQLYWLSGHLRIDRGDRGRALAAMDELASIVRRNRLSIWIWPEGTRSRTGRLLPFKKGIYHLALETGLPVQPVVVRGAQRAWGKGGMRIEPTTIEVEVLEPIDTSSWKDRPIEACLEEVHDVFLAALPLEQHPLADAA
jgi:1-acyl-sn-glycerol-3-phosphate acyltransferase